MSPDGTAQQQQVLRNALNADRAAKGPFAVFFLPVISVRQGKKVEYKKKYIK